jgi:SAM-dependent methyltransferase
MEVKMEKDYDEKITKHYNKVAIDENLSYLSTMKDEYTRQAETDSIVSFVDKIIKERQSEENTNPILIMDIGCGNGYTLDELSKKNQTVKFVGIEKNDSLRNLAESRFVGKSNVEIKPGDIRDIDFTEDDSVDILICQRVLINLLDKNDQKNALNNLIKKVKKGNSSKSSGKMLFIEAFREPLDILNRSREEFNLKEIPEAEHNLYLDEDFFEHSDIEPYNFIPSNFLSTHYFVTRVLHDVFISNSQTTFTRNSEFVKFFSKALNPNVGDYSPLKFLTFSIKE